MFLRCANEVPHLAANASLEDGVIEVMNSLRSMDGENTPPGVILQHRLVEYLDTSVWCNCQMEPDEQLVSRRRRLLKQEIDKTSQADVARRAGKPDRQIGDMAEGRKAFGDSVSREIGPKIRPDLPRDWLIFADEYLLDSGNVTPFEMRAMSKREGRIQSVVKMIRAMNESGIGTVEAIARLEVERNPLINQVKSSQ